MNYRQSETLVAICLNNKDYPDSLELHKSYVLLTDEEAVKDGRIRIVDESEKDVIYPADHFVIIELARIEFLERVLQVVQDSDANRLDVEALLEENLSLLDDNFIQVIKAWANVKKFEILEPQEKQQIARNIGNFSRIIWNYPQGKEIINMEIAIAGYQQSLNVLTYDAFPEKWANIKINLGNVYTWRIRGEKVENIEAAINAYNEALRLFTEETHPDEWARVQHNLGIAYRNRVRGDKNDNIDKAIKAYELALKYRTKKKYPGKWVQTQLSIANAYSEQHNQKLDREIESDKSPLQKAIEACESALEVCSQEETPYTWGEIHNCLGLAYCDKTSGKKADNLQKAIDNFELALQVFKKETYPEAYARIQNNLGIVYRRLFQEGIQKSTDAYRAALEIYTPERDRKNHVNVLFNLGFSYQIAGNFIKAYDTFKEVSDILELFRDEIVARRKAEKNEEKEVAFTSVRETDKKALAETWNILYQYMVEICLKLNKITEAIEYAERSKTRNLVELILSRQFNIIFPADVVTQLEKYKDEISRGQNQIQNGTATNPQDLAKRVQELRRKHNELRNQYFPIASDFQFDKFRMSLDKETAVVEFYIASKQLVVFIFTRTAQPIVFPPDLINLNELESWFNNYLKAYNQGNQEESDLSKSLTKNLSQLAKILCLDKIIEKIPTEYKQLILVPHRTLHLLPLHALPLAGYSSLFDRFSKGISYAPSCQLQQLLQTRQRSEFTDLFAIQNPTEDLAYADVEVKAIQSYFNNNKTLKQQEATKEDIKKENFNIFHCLHFSCHGEFKVEKPLKSYLMLANALRDDKTTEPQLNNCLTLDDIFTLKLEKCRLVTLSACETGLIDYKSITDEYIGLPSGFLYAGTSNVVSSLWKVNDLSTAFLTIQFYQNLQDTEQYPSVAIALNQAQLWLRDITKAELKVWITANSLPLDDTMRNRINKRLHKLQDDQKPFQDPFHWAAFCAIGQ